MLRGAGTWACGCLCKWPERLLCCRFIRLVNADDIVCRVPPLQVTHGYKAYLMHHLHNACPLSGLLILEMS